MSSPHPPSDAPIHASAHGGPAGRGLGPTADDPRLQLDESLTRLHADYPDVDPEALRSALLEAHRALADKPIQDFVPVLAERAARALIRNH